MPIFEESEPRRAASAQLPDAAAIPGDLPKSLLRGTPVSRARAA